MAGKYWWEEDTEQDKMKGQGYWWDDGTMGEKAAKNITDRVNTWLKNHNTYISNYQKRYSGRKFNYEDAYVSDSGSWLDTVTKQKSNFDAEADSILAYMDQFKDYFKEDWVKSVRDTLTKARSDQDSVLKGATQDNEWWSSFGSEELVQKYGSAEEAYKTNQRYDGYRKKYSSQKATDIEKALSMLADGEEKDWLTYNQYDFYQNDSAYNSKAASGFKSYEAQKIADQQKEEAEAVPMWLQPIMNGLTYSDATGFAQVHDIYQKDTSWREPSDEWSEKERKHFGYLYSKSPTQAYQYAEQLNNYYKAKAEYEITQGIGAMASDNFWSGAGHTLGAIATAPLGIVDYLDDLIEYGARGTITQDGMVTPFEYSQAVQSGISTKLNDISGTIDDDVFMLGGKGLGDVYSLGVSTVNSLASAYALGPVGTMANFIGQGAAAGVDDALSRGATPEQALWYGTILGAAEGVTEMIGVDNLLKINSSATLKNLILKALNQGLGETVEEGVSSVIGNVADNFIMQDKSNFNAIVKELMDADPNLSEEEAKSKAWLKMWGDTAFDALGGLASGFASGSIQGGVSTAVDSWKGNQANIDAVKQYGDKTGELIQEGLQSDVKSDSYKLATKYQKQTQGTEKKAGKAMTGFQIRNLLAANQEQITPKDLKLIQAAAEKRLTELGQTKDVSKLAELATKWATGQKLTHAEKNFLTKSEYGAKVAKQLHPDTIQEKYAAMEWARENGGDNATIAAEDDTAWAEGIGTRKVNAMAYNIRAILDAMTEDPAAYKSLESRAETEKPAQVSDTGKAVIRDTDTEIDLTAPKIKSITKDSVILDVNGEEVDIDSIDFANEDQWNMFNALKKIEHITPGVASDMIAKLDMTKPAWGQLNAMDEAFTYGFHNYSEADLKAGNFVGNLTKDQLNDAYNLGKYVRKNSIDVDESDRKKMRTAADAKLTQEQKAEKQKARIESDDVEVYFQDGKSVVKFDDHGGKYDEKRMAAVNTAKFLSKLGIGGKYIFFKSYVNAKGERVYKNADGIEENAPNGMYMAEDGSIRIDLNAGENGQGVALFTMGHELTHFIKDKSEKQFKVLCDLVEEAYSKTDMSMHKRVLAKQKFLEANRGKDVSYDEAYEEVVCDAMSTMLSDGNFHEKIMEIKVKDKGLFDTIKRFFEDLIANFKRAYEKLDPDQKDARDIREMKDMFDRIQTAFAEALVEASDNFHAEQIGVEIDTDTESVSPAVMNSERTWTESEYVQERDKAAKEIAKAIGVSEKKAKDYIDSVNSIAKMIAEDRSRLDYFSSPGRSSFVDNSEYGGSFDFSTLCKKRRLLTGTFTAIQKALPNTALTADEILDIRNRMKEANLEVSCGLCYVEGSRANMGQFAKEFLRLYKQYYPDAWQPNMADVNTPDGIEWVRINHPECYEQYEYFWNHYGTLKPGDKNLFASQQKPKLYQLHTEYKGEILNKFKNDDKVEDKNLNGGIRLQSFSDFEIVHLIDTMQIIMDMSRVGLAGQAYTKVPDFAWALGDTGLKINLSLIAKGVDENGKLIFDDVEGMPITEAMKLRDRYSKNVGTILVAFNDEQLLAAMADDRVDFIIPFHRSQWKKSQYEAMGLPAKTKDYTFMQNEKYIKPQFHEYRGRMVKDKATNYMPNEYWDFSKSGKENAEAYLEMCARNNKRPKFYKLLQNNGDGSYSLKADGSTDGYWKLLIDFKMYDNDGNGSPQMAVKPDFNMDEATRMLNDYSGGHSNFPVAQGIVDGFVKDYNASHKGVKHSDRDGGSKIGTLYSERSVTSWDIAWDSDNSSSLKSQMLAHQDEINAMSPVTNVVFDKSKGKTYAAILDDILRTRFGYRIERQDGATFLFDEEAIATLRHYVGSDEEAAAVIAAPYVLKRGKAISGHKNHKNRGYPSVTYAAPVTINGDTVNVAVSVLFADKDRPHSLRVLMPDGKEYVIQKIKTDPEMEEATPKGGVPSPTGSVSNKKVSQPKKKVKKNSTKNSDRNNAPTFYSQMGKVVEGMKQEKFGASSVISMLRGRGVKAEEIRWSGIHAFLDGKKSVTKAELLEFVQGSMLHIDEQELGSTGKPELWDDFYRHMEDVIPYFHQEEIEEMCFDYDGEFSKDKFESALQEYVDDGTISEMDFEEAMEYAEEMEKNLKSDTTTKWSQYKLDGGTNYRELVFKMPGSTYSNQAMEAHWGRDAKGVIAHARMQDFEVDGKKMLFIEEIQSDWHNAGQKQGYFSEGDKVTVKNTEMRHENGWYNLYHDGKDLHQGVSETFLKQRFANGISEEEIHDGLVDEYNRAVEHSGQGWKAPDAPFKSNYHEYVLKRLLRMAAEEGYDSIGWTTADIQSDRWNEAYAEGYRIEYDQDIPKFLRKYGKQWGAEVGRTPLPGLDAGETYYDVSREETFATFAEWKNTVLARLKSEGKKAREVVFEKEHGSGDFIAYDDITGQEYDRARVNKRSDTVWSMDITPAMKKSVLEEGQVLYSDRDYTSYDRTAILKEETVDRWLLDYASKTSPNYAQMYITYIRPEKFLDLTTSITSRHHIEMESKKLNEAEFADYTKDQPILLEIDHETGEVTGHEGRHRCVALLEAGIREVPVLLWDLSNRYDKQAIDSLTLTGQHFKNSKSYASVAVKDIIPLSRANREEVIKRFATQSSHQKIGERIGYSKTLRFSERGDGTSNRDLLANAFEGITKSSIEYKLIQQYKTHIEELNELEAKLSDLNAEIYKIRFGTTGAMDTARLARLENEAKEVAKAISDQDKKLLSLEASGPLRKLIELERKKEAKKTIDHVNEIIQNKKVRAEQTELRHKIRKVIRDLDKVLKHGNKQKNVKEDMKGFVSKALELADYLFTDHISNDELIRRGIDAELIRGEREAQLVKETEEILSKLYYDFVNLTAEEYAQLDAKKKRNMDKLRDLLTAQRNKRLSTPVYNLFNDLVTEYASFKNSKQEAVKAAYDPNVERFLREYMGESNGETDSDRKSLLQNMRVADMTTKELEHLLYAYKMVLHSVRDANKFHVQGMTQTIEQVVGQIAGDFGSRKIPEKKLAIAAQKLVNKLGWDYEKLYYALERIGSETFTKLIMNIADSENTVMQDIIEATAFRDQIVKKYGFNNWAVNKEIDREFMDNSGKKFKMTLGQMMSLYAYSRREGAWDHIEYGGFVFGEAALTNPKPADSYKLSKAQCEAITSLLTKEQKGYVEEMQKFLSETMGEKGNEVSMKLYGIKMFGEKNYFPIHIAGQFKAQAQESQAKQAAGFGSMSNAGFTHAQNPNAKAPFVLEGFNEIWTDHVNEMSRYHGTVPALEDLRRVMNRSTYSDSVAESQSIKQLMENHYGKEAVDYFDNLYKEANSGAITDKLQKDSKWLLSKFRKNSVAYSLSVLIQQPASLVRAYAMIDKKYFGFKGFGTITSGVATAVSDKWTKAHTNAYNEMLKYAPGVTMAKEIGGFDTATGGSIRSYLLDTNKSLKQKWNTGTAMEKGKAVLDVVDDNAIANLPNVADKIAWIEIWNACKRETVATHKNLTPGSDEFMQAVGKRFTEVIRATQVYDSIFAKSPMLKSKNLAVQMLVSFMNEPNTVANMVESAVRDVARGNLKKGARTAAVVVHSIIFTNVLKSIIYAMRDDDEDETYIEKYVESIVGGMMNDLNALNYIPLARDVVSLAQGYDVARADMAIIADLLDAVEKVAKYKNTDTEGMTEEQLIELDKKMIEANWKLVESISAFFGIPVKNIRREINGVLDHARIASANAGKTTALSTWDTIYEAVIDSLPDFLAPKTEPKTDKLYEAIISGDKSYLGRLKSTYKTDPAYQSAVRKALRENDSRIHDAAQAKYEGKTEEYKRIFKEIQKEGQFTFDEIMDAVNAEENAIRNGIEPDKGTSQYSASGFVESIILDDAKSAQAMRDDIIATHMANGKSQADAEEAFASAVVSSIGDAYSTGLLDEAGAENMLMEYAGKDKEKAASKVSYWAFCEANPKYKDIFTESHVKKYYEFAEPEGISVDVYAQYINDTKGLTTKYDEWGDVGVSKREQVLEAINSLPLTWQQKDALYLAAGYAESEIWDVPW